MIGPERVYRRAGKTDSWSLVVREKVTVDKMSRVCRRFTKREKNSPGSRNDLTDPSTHDSDCCLRRATAKYTTTIARKR